jgi:hypothetical protein
MRLLGLSLLALLLVAMLAAGAQGNGAASSSISLVGTPVLYVDTGSDQSIDRPVAWVLLHTRERLHEARRVIASVDGTSGRSYVAREAVNCIRSTVVGSGKSRFAAGRTYTVRIAVRATAYSSDRKVLLTTSLRAHGYHYPAGTRHPPRCAVG